MAKQKDHPRYRELHQTWCGMMHRCYKAKGRTWERYGGRGIKVCKRWHTFANFALDMPPRPLPWDRRWTIDRINNDRGYNPRNVRWATRSMQSFNKTLWTEEDESEYQRDRAILQRDDNIRLRQEKRQRKKLKKKNLDNVGNSR